MYTQLYISKVYEKRAIFLAVVENQSTMQFKICRKNQENTKVIHHTHPVFYSPDLIVPLSQNPLEWTGPLVLHNFHFTGTTMDGTARAAADKTRLWQIDCGLGYLHLAAFTKTAPLHGSGPDLKSNCPPV